MRVLVQKGAKSVGFQTRPTMGLLFCLVLLMILSTLGSPSLAQSPEGWGEAVNLSQSGAASDPTVIPGPEGGVRVLWWDRFDGFYMREGTVLSAQQVTWQEAQALPLTVPEEVRGETVRVPVSEKPAIVGDRAGGAHALWLGNPDAESGERPLWYSRLPAGSGTWSWSVPLAPSAAAFALAADEENVLHLAYVRPTDDGTAAGVYYRISSTGGASWGAAQFLYGSTYYRLVGEDLSETDVALRLAAAGDELAVTWNDPRQGQTVLAFSPDGGETWPGVGSVDTAIRAQPFAVGGEAWLLWEDTRAMGICVVVQAQASDPEGTRRVADGWTGCAQDLRFHDVGEDVAYASRREGEDALAVLYWTGRAGDPWSAGPEHRVTFADPDLDRSLSLSNLQADTVVTGAEAVVVIAGEGGRGEVWATQRSAIGLRVRDAETQPVAEPGADTVAINLSRSGAASMPAVVVSPGGSVRALWWDRFAGLQVAEGTVVPAAGEEGLPSVTWVEPVSVPAPFAEMPDLWTDGDGQVHALWLERASKSAVDTLWYSLLSAGTSNWSTPVALGEGVAAYDLAVGAHGDLYLAYLRSAHSDEAPAGVYARRAEGALWGPPVLLYGSLYYRLLGPAGGEMSDLVPHLRLAVQAVGRLVVTWDDLHLERAMLSTSEDRGDTWLAPIVPGDEDKVPGSGGQVPSQAEVFVQPDDETWLLWADRRYSGSCALYQAAVHVPPREGTVVGSAERVLSDLRVCPERIAFHPTGGGGVLMVAGRGGDTLSTALWQDRWSEARRLSYRFSDPEAGQIYLSQLGATWLPEQQALLAVGVDQNGEVWSVSPAPLETVFAPLSPWSQPTRAIESTGGREPTPPALAVDGEGILHALWTEPSETGEPGKALYYAYGRTSFEGDWQWSTPVAVIQSPGGRIQGYDLVSSGDRLHAVWSDGPGGEIAYSQAFVRDAASAQGWSAPKPLSGSLVGSDPALAVVGENVLYAVYAVPLNEGRGINFTFSEDGGLTWFPESPVFDAAAAAWEQVGAPQLAVDGEGTIHMVWTRLPLPGHGAPLGVYSAHSLDGGISWSDPVEVAAGAYAWPLVAAGLHQVHVLWGETDGQARGGGTWWHQWEGPDGWSRPEQVRGLAGVSGPLGLALSASALGTEDVLTIAGLGLDEAGEPALLQVSWQEGAWGTGTSVRLASGESAGMGVQLALDAASGQLHAVYPASATTVEEEPVQGLWHSRREVLVVEQVTAPALAARPTAVPVPTTTPAPTRTPRPTVNVAAPPPPEPSNVGPIDLPLPLIGGGVLAMVVVGAVLLTRRVGGRRR